MCPGFCFYHLFLNLVVMAARPSKEVTAENERRAWELRQKCWTEQRIADEIGVSQSAVAQMLKRANKKLFKEFIARAEEIKAEQTAQIEYIAAEALRAWEASEGEIEIRRKSVKREGVIGKDGQPKYLVVNDEVVRDEDGQPVTETMVTEHAESTETRHHNGDPRYLAEARSAKADIRDIWGLNAPKEASVALTLPKAYVNVDLDAV